MAEIIDREIGWDDEIVEEGGEFVLLPEGDYNFEVLGFERNRHAGSAKLPPCNKAILSLKVYDDVNNRSTVIKHNLFLHSRTEGMVSAFLLCIGQKKHGEPCRPKWQQMAGATGKAKIGIREWTGNDGSVKQSNEIKKFYEKKGADEVPPADVIDAFGGNPF